MRTMICEKPLSSCQYLAKPCPHATKHQWGPECIILCKEDKICKEVEEKTDWELVAQQQG